MGQAVVAIPPAELPSESRSAPVTARMGVAAGAGAVLLACGGFILLWWNRYLSPTVGGELFFASMAERGALPYRDYFFPMQPGLVFQSVWLSSIFGQKLIVFWILGVGVRLASALCLYAWLVRWFRPAVAAAAVVTTFFVSSADIADFPAFYNHEAMAFALFGAFCAMKALEAQGGFAWALAAGFLLATNFWIKQTTGVVVDFALVVAFGVASGVLLGFRQAIAKTATIVLGLAVPVAAVGYWLYRHQLLGDYFDQVYLSGPASKGGLVASLLRPVALTDANRWLHWPAFLALLSLGMYAYSWCRKPAKSDESFARLAFFALAAACTLVILRAELWQNALITSHTPLLGCAYLALLGNFLVIAYTLIMAVRGRSDLRIVELGFLGVVGFACAYSLSISWAAFETMAFPGLALLMALVFQRVFGEHASTVGRALTVAACLLLLGLAGKLKYTEPFSWGYLSEPPLSQPTVPVASSALEGFNIAGDTARLLAEIPELIRSHSHADERILIYPHMPVFYALGQRRMAGFAVMHWMDVCPDRVALRDAATLQTEPPAVIVSMEMPLDVYRNQEDRFRNGQPSGQRRLAEVLASLIPAYNLVGEFQSPGYDYPIKVWARKR